MRTQTADEQKIAIALAIYRGLPDSERAAKLSEWRTLPGYHARTLVVLCEQYEMSVRAEKERLSALEREVQFVRAQLATRTDAQPDIYGQERAEIRRGAFGVLAVIACVGAAAYAFHVFGVWPVIATVGGAYILSRLGGGGSEQSDYSAAPGQANTVTTGQTIIFNVSQNGDVNFIKQ